MPFLLPSDDKRKFQARSEIFKESSHPNVQKNVKQGFQRPDWITDNEDG